MKNEIIVEQERIKLSKLVYEKGDTSVTVPDRTALRYQKIYMIGDRWQGIRIEGKSKISVSPDFSEAWVIERTKAPGKKETHGNDDIRVLKLISLCLYLDRNLSLCEVLCKETGDRNVIDAFYSSYSYREFEEKIKETLDTGYMPKLIGSSRKMTYRNSRYSILEFAKDIKGCEICINSDLLSGGDYISRLKKDARILPAEKDWVKVLGTQKNTRRANLNILYQAPVVIDVPENDHGVAAGPRELKTVLGLCLIKDGTLWTKTFGIKVSDPALKKKLRAFKVIGDEVLGKDKYMVNLESLPVIRKCQLRGVRPELMAKRRIQYLLYSAASEYYSRLVPTKTTIKSKVSVEDLYLRSLGIYGDQYYPTKTVCPKKYSYTATVLEPKVTGIPKDLGAGVRSVMSGTSRSKAFSEYLKHLVPIPGKSYQEMSVYYKELAQKEAARYSDLVFRAILGKFSLESKNLIGKRERYCVFPGQYVDITWELRKRTITV